jgi:hypothetical protein
MISAKSELILLGTSARIDRSVGWPAGRSTLCHNQNREMDRLYFQNMDAIFTHTTQHAVHNSTARNHPLIDFKSPPYLRFCSVELGGRVYGRITESNRRREFKFYSIL